jgi:steroid 5-alpha reductase family enzyme
MAAFKADPSSTGSVMDSGLWRFTRHPNYFGDTCVWWGLYLIAAETALGRFSVIGPVLLTFTLLRWSGVTLLERRLRRSRPGYDDYIARTSAFLPWPPKNLRDKGSS